MSYSEKFWKICWTRSLVQSIFNKVPGLTWGCRYGALQKTGPNVNVFVGVFRYFPQHLDLIFFKIKLKKVFGLGFAKLVINFICIIAIENH